MVNHYNGENDICSKSNDPAIDSEACGIAAQARRELVEGPRDCKWEVYIAQSLKTKHYYTGISLDPQKRVKLHNARKGVKFAIDQGPLKLVYASKGFLDKSVARKREIQIKCWRAEKKRWLIEKTIRQRRGLVAESRQMRAGVRRLMFQG